MMTGWDKGWGIQENVRWNGCGKCVCGIGRLAGAGNCRFVLQLWRNGVLGIYDMVYVDSYKPSASFSLSTWYQVWVLVRVCSQNAWFVRVRRTRYGPSHLSSNFGRMLPENSFRWNTNDPWQIRFLGLLCWILFARVSALMSDFLVAFHILCMTRHISSVVEPVYLGSVSLCSRSCGWRLSLPKRTKSGLSPSALW